MGFFELSTITKAAPMSTVAKCGACGIYKQCHSPKMPVDGDGRKDVMIIAEAPGANEDAQNKPLIGDAGSYLNGVLKDIGVDMRKDCWLTNALICRPPKNRTPTSQEIDYCRPNLIKAIKHHKPKVIIPLGAVPVASLMQWLWKPNDIGSIGRWVGWQIPNIELNAWICPTWHPSYMLRTSTYKDAKMRLMLWKNHLRVAFKRHKRRPHKRRPDYAEQVELITSHKEAATSIEHFLDENEEVAFDFETTTIKPEHEGAQIVSCAVANRHRTVAYPFVGDAVTATRRVLRSKLPKIAANLKFEERWAKKVLKTRVRNWRHDTMVNAHVLDSRAGITSVKFQSFVLLGVKSYDDHISKLLRAKKNKTVNQILEEIELNDLLTYNGLDSLLELKIADKQRQLMSPSGTT